MINANIKQISFVKRTKHFFDGLWQQVQREPVIKWSLRLFTQSMIHVQYLEQKRVPK